MAIQEPTKQKSFKISEDLAIEFEIQAKRSRTKEVDLITRYIQEGLERDQNEDKQSTLD
ncbi:hypothetical protein [Methanobrevibacter sp.]|jgi:hypothetical protein|uniref:hypothetical protein n=1 Tax=Methanobrevibacter sp. TaxID=66852 RepID=UPI0025E8DC6F|nr:hypothetical protein [Methanobrevibacter sp.]